MRADRLLSLLMLLQTRGRMTARELAKQLEVSERTIYRDIDALSAAGVPVYSEAGPEGGYALVDRYRTTLTGLTEGEVRALFMLSIPAPLADLGVSQKLRTALLKLTAALPEVHRHAEERVRQRFHLDSTWWRNREELVPHLLTIHQAIWQDYRLHITYHPPFAIEIERLVDPYGLVAKAGVWYLVFARNGAIRVHRVSNLLNVRISDKSFERPAGFNLAVFWEEWSSEHETLLFNYSTTVRVSPNLIPELPRHFGSQIHTKIEQAGPPDADGWIRLELCFESFDAARERILSFGRAAEVLRPQALQKSVLDYAEQIVSLYTT